MAFQEQFRRASILVLSAVLGLIAAFIYMTAVGKAGVRPSNESG